MFNCVTWVPYPSVQTGCGGVIWFTVDPVAPQSQQISQIKLSVPEFLGNWQSQFKNGPVILKKGSIFVLEILVTLKHKQPGN
jgi:hypothetical protein